MRTVRPHLTTLVVILALFATLATSVPTWAVDSNTPVVPVPAERWGDLEPRAVPGDTTYFTFSSADGEPDCRSPFWHGITAAGGFVIAAAGNSIEVWDARQDPGDPTFLQTLCRPVLGSFKKDDTDFFFFRVAVVPNDPSLIAVANGSTMGVMVLDNRQPGNAYTIYQDEGSSTLSSGKDYSAGEVVALKSGSRRLLYVRATNKDVIAYDLDRIAQMSSPCLQENGCVNNVFLGVLPATATKIAGAGKYLFTLFGSRIDVWDTSTSATNPTLVGTVNPKNFVLDVAGWQVGGKTFLAGTGFQTTEVWDIACLPNGCANSSTLLSTPSSNFVTASVDPSSGRAYLYVGSELTRLPAAQVEYLFDAATWEELTPDHPDGYWGWYYPGNPTGFNNTRALAAVVQNGHVYRAAYSFFDIHEIVGAGRPPVASFGWTPQEPYAGDPVSFADSSTGAPNAWGWTFVGANVNSASTKNPNSITFLAPTSQANPTTATLTAFNDLGASDPLTKSITVRDPAPSVGTPVASVSTAPVCSVIEFTASATGKPPLAYDWDVVDSGDQPLNTGGASGNVFAWSVPQSLTPEQYRASLVVSGVGSTPQKFSAPVTIQALDPLALTSGPTASVPDFGLVRFAVTDAGATAWTWDFGDGNCPAGFTPVAAGCRTTNPALGRNPEHQYTVGETTYDVTVTIENCRDGSITSDVLPVAVGAVQELLPKFAAQGICIGIFGCISNVDAQIVFTNETTGFPDKYEIDWNGNGTFVEVAPQSGQFTHAYTQVNQNPGYKPVLRVTRGSQVKTFQHQAILVEPLNPGQQPSVSVSRTNASPLVGATVVFTATAKNCTAPTSWTWSIGSGGSINGGATGSSINVSYSSAGNRTVRATAVGGGCNGLIGSTTVNVKSGTTPPPPPPPMGNNPTARLTYSPSSPSAGDTVSFDASTSSNATSYQWDFGDGNSATGVKVTHAYDEAGSYVVKLEASRADSACDFNICVGSTQTTVVVDDDTPPPPPPSTATNGCEGTLADDPGTLCLLDGRFQVQVDWTNQHNGDDEGIGQGELYSGSKRTGLFWFFNPDNVELIVKMIDASEVDGKIWFFYGALSDVKYTIRVLDTATGTEKTYSNQAGAICGLGDTGAFLAAVPPSSSGASLPPTSALGSSFAAGGLSAVYGANHGVLPHDEEEPAANVLPLLGGRFEVSVDFTNQYNDDAPGVGTPIVGTSKSGYFWFFRPDNLELVVKMIDARPVTGNFWVFWGGLSDVKYNIHIRDTQTENEWTYSNPAGSICGGADLEAFNDVPL